jgi:2',3'-cyclic-nucleotide 2'-phosphodiesterase
MKVLFIGDIVGKPGREVVRRAVPALLDRHDLDLVIANVENAAGGFGVTREIVQAIRSAGVDVMTTGNHVWDKKEVFDFIELEPHLLRPANYPAGVPGRGSCLIRSRSGRPVGVINVMGRVFMLPIDSPFTVVLDRIAGLRAQTPVIIVDFHAEASSEKMAMGWHLDGQVTAVIGTHTHVQTADDRILPGGTAYITDAGMSGPHDSIIGTDKAVALGRFLNALPARFEPASGDPRLHGVIVTADPDSGRALGIERVSLSLKDIQILASSPLSTR